MTNELGNKLNITTCHPSENDIQWILRTVDTTVVSPFEVSSLKQLLEITPWSLIAKHQHENKAYAAFVDYPCQDHFSTAWYQSIEEHWNKSSYSGVKTIFLHFLMSESETKLFLEEILKVTFQSIPSLGWCCIVADKFKPLDPGIEELFQRDDAVSTQEFQFWFTKRNSYIPQVGIRNKRYEDYLALKNIFSQMYGSFKNDDLKNLTLDFLDYGEDRCPTYKYFTYDDDNTYIGIVDDNKGEAIGFIYATIRRIDLDLMNEYFQLETVYGLRKKHPSDTNISFDEEFLSGSEESSDEEDEIREIITNIVDEVVFDSDVSTCLNDIIDDVCEPVTRHRRRKTEFMSEKTLDDIKTLINSQDFMLKDPKHLSLLTRKNVKNFTTETLLRLINSDDFDAANELHMKLVPRLGENIKNVNQDRLQQIINSDIFDPSKEDFATISLHVMSHIPEGKLRLFKKSSVGCQIYDKLMYHKALAKKNEILKAKKNKPTPKLSFKDTQIILHFLKNETSTQNIEKVVSNAEDMTPEELKHVKYRNMGFISGLTMRGKYRIQGNCRIPKIKEPFGYEPRPETEMQKMENDIEAYEKYPVVDMNKEYRLIQAIPKYNGGTNCFYVEQFAMEQEYQSQCLYLIMAAFQYFPRVDYCMLLLPYGTRQVPHLRFHFSRVPARPFSAFGAELFVYHKAAFNRSYTIRICKKKDVNGVKKLIACSCLKEYLLKDLADSLVSSNKEMQAVVLLSEGRVFGIAIVKEIKEVEIIRKNYDVAERIDMKYHKYRSQAQLLHCVLHPIFNFFSNMFLKEIMQLCKKSILYYKVYPTHLIPYDPTMWQSLCNVIEHFIPLKPITKSSHKKSSEKPYFALNVKSTDDVGNKTSTNDYYYCLCYTCTKIVLRNKIINSSRIVVIGDSDLALGVLESLVYRCDCRYTNIIIISKCGIRGEIKLDEKCNNFLPRDIYYSACKLDNLCLPAWVTVIRGEVVSIAQDLLRLCELSSRKKKHFSVGFDYLVICNNLGFQTTYAKKLLNYPSESKYGRQYSLLKGLWRETYVVAKNASNVFAVNNLEEAATVLNWLWRYFLQKVESRKQPKKKYKNLIEMERDKKEGRIVIYGNYLEAYTALAVIIAEEYPLSKITFVKARSTDLKTGFSSKFIQEAVDHIIQKSGLELIMDADIEYDKEAEEVINVDITTDLGMIRLDCCALLLFNEKRINCSIFQALHRSSLSFTLPLYNSRGHPYLLINRNFQTNIANVFAAGTFTEMHTNGKKCIRFEDQVYNKREIGMIVGENLSRATNDSLDISNGMLPTLHEPVITYAKLPCSYVYILITDPSTDFQNGNDEKEVENHVTALVLGNLQTGIEIIPAPLTQEEIDLLTKCETSEERLEYQEFLKEMGRLDQEEREKTEVTKTERVLPDMPEYFGIVFSETETIKTIECLTNKDIDVAALKNLLGSHVTKLYKILQRVQLDSSEKVFFQLMETWILPLDYVTFKEDTAEEYSGYESYWRPGYPKQIEQKLNTFLDSFVMRKGK